MSGQWSERKSDFVGFVVMALTLGGCMALAASSDHQAHLRHLRQDTQEIADCQNAGGQVTLGAGGWFEFCVLPPIKPATPTEETP